MYMIDLLESELVYKEKMQKYCTVTERLFCCRDYTSIIFVVLDSGLPFDVLYIIIIIIIYLIMC